MFMAKSRESCSSELHTNLSSAKGIEAASVASELAGAAAQEQRHCMHSQLLHLLFKILTMFNV